MGVEPSLIVICVSIQGSIADVFVALMFLQVNETLRGVLRSARNP